MKSPRPVILNDEIYEIPIKAAAALSHRAVARMLEILPHADAAGWPARAHEITELLLRRLEVIASDAKVMPGQYILEYSLYAETQLILNSLPGGTCRRAGWLCVQSAMHPGGMGAQRAISGCRHLMWNIMPTAARKKGERIVCNATWEDFRKVRLAFEAGELLGNTPLPPASLGPLWPKGSHDWTQFIWRNIDTENEAREREAAEGDAVLDNLLPRGDALPADIQEALDRAANARGDGWRNAFFPPGPKPSSKWPKSLREPTTRFTRELLDFHLVHGWGGLLIPPSERRASVWLIPAVFLSEHRAKMLDWDSAHDCFDPNAVQDANRYSASLGFEPNARLAPCSKRDLLVFAQVEASPDAFLVVTKGPAAGRVFFFNHETGIDFDAPIADSMAGWIDALVDPTHEWEWLDADDT